MVYACVFALCVMSMVRCHNAKRHAKRHILHVSASAVACTYRNFDGHECCVECELLSLGPAASTTLPCTQDDFIACMWQC